MNQAGTAERAADDSDGDRIRVLHVEDDESFGRVTRKFLERADAPIEVTGVSDPRVVLDRLAEEPFEFVLSDYDMPGLSGIELLERVREAHPELPFILFTGKGSEEVASDAFSAGATDYFQKSTDTNEFDLLAERITAAVEKYRTERRLARSEERYRRLVETAPVPIAVHRGDEIAFANDAVAEFLGVDAPSDLVGKDPLSFLETDDRAVAAERVQRLLEQETTADPLEEKYVDADGKVKHALITGAAVEFEGERGVQAVLQDVTGRKERERELARYRQLVEAMGDGVYALDPDGHIEMVNRRMTDLSGYDREALVDRYGGELLTDDSLEAVKDTIRGLIGGGRDGRTLEVTLVRRDGTELPLQMTLTLQPTGDGTFGGIIGVAHDISDRLERERELREAEEKFRKFFEHTNDAVFVVDIEADEIREANPAAAELMGYAREELRGTSPGEFHPDNLDEVVGFTERVVDRGHGSLERVVCHARDGPVECEMSAAVCEIDGRTYLINSVRPLVEC